MLRLIEPEVPSARQPNTGQGAPALLPYRWTHHTLFAKPCHFGWQIVAHQIEFVFFRFFSGMERRFRRRQREDKPAMSGIDRRELEHLFEEDAIRLRVLTVQDYVCS